MKKILVALFSVLLLSGVCHAQMVKRAESDPKVKAVNGIVKSNGTTISAASPGTDYLAPTGNGSQLTNMTASQVGLGSVTNNAQVKKAASSTDGKLPKWSGASGDALVDGYGVTTNLGSPGADTNIPTEAAVRAAIATAGGGDVSGPSSVASGQVCVYSGTSGKLIDKYSGTGLLKASSGVPSAASAGVDYATPTGNVATASSLLANGSNCPSGQAAAGVSATGAAEGCFTPLTTESDPKIGTQTNGKWCSSNGSQIICTQDAPAGTGDITQVGDCASGDAFSGSCGNTITLKSQTSGTIAIKPAAISNNNIVTVPAETGTMCTTGSVCSGYQSSLGFTAENSANKAAASGYASLNSSSLVVQDPANATANPTANKIPKADANGKLDAWISQLSITSMAQIDSSLKSGGAAGSKIATVGSSALSNGKIPVVDSNGNLSNGPDAPSGAIGNFSGPDGAQDGFLMAFSGSTGRLGKQTGIQVSGETLQNASTPGTISACSFTATCSGQSPLNQGLKVNVDQGAQSMHDFQVLTKTEANAIYCNSNGDYCVIGGSTNGVKIAKGGIASFLGTSQISPPSGVYANRPATPETGSVYLLTDGTSAGDCSAGGGSARVLCRYSGSAWQSFGDGGSGGSVPSDTISLTDGLDITQTSAPTIAAGAALGSGPSINYQGSNGSGLVYLYTGTSTTTGTAFTLTYSKTYSRWPAPTIDPANDNAKDAEDAGAKPYVDVESGSTSTAVFKVRGTALTAGTKYLWSIKTAGR